MNKIYLDMDGVLADFEGTWEKLTGKKFSDYSSSKEFWAIANHLQRMYRCLDFIHDAHILVEGVNSYRPKYEIEVLTAIPLLECFANAEQDKKDWIDKHFPHNWKFNIGPYAVDKQKFARSGDILIDDKKRNIDQWIAAGGIGILHVSAIDTLEQLNKIFPRS